MDNIRTIFRGVYILVIFFGIRQNWTHVEALPCYNCMAIDCTPQDGTECEGIRSFTQSELTKQYHFSESLDLCPPVPAVLDWISKTRDNGECPKGNNGACSLGKIQVKTFGIDKEGNLTRRIRYNHATITCSDKGKLSRVNTFVKNFNGLFNATRCYSARKNTTPTDGGVEVVHQLEIVHCGNISNHGDHTDYCVSYQDGHVQILPELEQESYLGTGCLITVGVLFVFLLVICVAGLLRQCRPRISGQANRSVFC